LKWCKNEVLDRYGTLGTGRTVKRFGGFKMKIEINGKEVICITLLDSGRKKIAERRFKPHLGNYHETKLLYLQEGGLHLWFDVVE